MEPIAQSAPSTLLKKYSQKVAILRIVFGVIWGVDAAFKFEPAFYRGLLNFVKAKDGGEPSWLNPWFHAWYHIIGSSQETFAIIVIVIEVLIALSLLLGIARRFNYLAAAVFSFLIWGVGEAFGGPYVAGTTDINAGFIYVMVFLLLYVCDGLVAPVWSLDTILDNRISWWHYLSGSPLKKPLALATVPKITKAKPKTKKVL